MRPLIAIPLSLLSATLLVLTACSDPEPETDESTPTPSAEAPEASLAVTSGPGLKAAAGRMQQQARETGEAMMASCRVLQERVSGFLSDPDDAGRDAARDAWHDCYAQWNRFLIFHQVAFNPRDAASVDRSRQLINTRPFHPGYIDGLPDHPYSGLVHETGMVLSLGTLLDQHRMMDDESAALGFPVLETLLWREPLPELWIPTDDDADNAALRRREYLRLATDDLLAQLQTAVDRWTADTHLRELPSEIQARVLLRSMASLVRQHLLSTVFTEVALDDPEWHHPSALAGQGQRHLLARLSGLSALLESEADAVNPITTWINDAVKSPTSTELTDHLRDARDRVSALGENAPLGSVDAEAFNQARQALETLWQDLDALAASASTRSTSG